MKKIRSLFYLTFVIVLAITLYHISMKYWRENKVLKEIIVRLEAESRIAEVLVTNVNYDENTKRRQTTIKFLEYDVKGEPLEPRYFTFSGNIIQFQSLVIRFDDMYVKKADKLKGKSIYLFWKAFMLDGENTQEYEITKTNKVPTGYKIDDARNDFEEKLWEKIWLYVLKPDEADKIGIKNAQIEAPGTMFVPGSLYTLKIEHDGGIRIDVSPLPAILKGEKIFYGKD